MTQSLQRFSHTLTRVKHLSQHDYKYELPSFSDIADLAANISDHCHAVCTIRPKRPSSDDYGVSGRARAKGDWSVDLRALGHGEGSC
jgi:hypothetical protein